MANRRMFSLLVIDTDVFLDLPLTSQALYFHLSMRADDDGFIGNAKKIRRMIGASEGDMDMLIDKGFVLKFETGVCVVKHWRIHNYIQADRYNNTIYKREKELVHSDDNKVYQIGGIKSIPNESETDTDCKQPVNNMDTPCIQGVNTVDTQVRLELGKVSIGKINKDNTVTKKRKVFKKPTLDEVCSYCLERNNTLDSKAFLDYYDSKGWLIGKSPMKDWKAAVRNWERNQKPSQTYTQNKHDYQGQMTEEEINAYDR